MMMYVSRLLLRHEEILKLRWLTYLQSFTMDMMLQTLNIDLKLIGYDKIAQRWDG